MCSVAIFNDFSGGFFCNDRTGQTEILCYYCPQLIVEDKVIVVDVMYACVTSVCLEFVLRKTFNYRSHTLHTFDTCSHNTEPCYQTPINNFNLTWLRRNTANQ